MMQARGMAKSGLLELLCRPPQDSDRDVVLATAANACLSVPGAHRAWARLRTQTVEAPAGVDPGRYPYSVEVPVNLAGRICGIVGLETDKPANGTAHERAAAVADLLATWEARRCLSEASPPQTMVGCSAEIRYVELLARRYAGLDEPVLIQGETGVGKELIAQTLHCLSARSERGLWTINCAAVPDELIASELFGHRRGAFTGAVRDQRGRFEMADGATLFLDEIGEMGPTLQAALLRVLEYGEIQQLGDEGRMRRINVRVIAASNRDLAAEVAAGRFRSDLYYRLTPLTIDIPPLRQRPEDIPVLARYFVTVLEERWGHSLEIVTKALNDLIEYPFPGNARELRNLVLRAAATNCEGQIADIPFPQLVRPFHAATSRSAKGSRNGNGNRRAPTTARHPVAASKGHRRKPANGNRDRNVQYTDPEVFLASLGGDLGRLRGNGGNGAPHGNGNGAHAHAPAGGNGSGNGHAPVLNGSRRDSLSLDLTTAAHLRRVLVMAEGNVSCAARMLQIPRTTLQSKLRRYGVS